MALGGLGNNRGAVVGGLALGLFQQAANFLVGGIFSSVAVFALFIVVLLARAAGPVRRAHGAEGVMDMQSPPIAAPSAPAPLGAALSALRCRSSASARARRSSLPLRRQRLLGADRARAPAIYWVLVSGLNLVVGFAGQLAIG